MENKLQKAINNNIGLYKVIFRNHNISLQITDEIAYNVKRVPRYYANLITRSIYWQPEAIFQNIDHHYNRERWNEWSVKDSFQVLDLTTYGFEKLFNAQWIYLELNNFKLGEVNNLRYVIIKSEEALSQWRQAWDTDINTGKAIFDAELLNHSNVYFIAGYDKDEVVTGCFINKTEDVLGISNFFAPDRSVNYWSTIIHFIHNNIEKKDIVGYEREELASNLATIGFETLGNLSIWLKKR